MVSGSHVREVGYGGREVDGTGSDAYSVAGIVLMVLKRRVLQPVLNFYLVARALSDIISGLV